MCDKGFRFALAGVCKYQVLHWSAYCLHQSANTQQVPGIQVPHYRILQVIYDEQVLCPTICVTAATVVAALLVVAADIAT
ncbi:MAG: hypothetical protein ACKPKO_07580, partial [Candidatus Fonsibacter sp.]